MLQILSNRDTLVRMDEVVAAAVTVVNEGMTLKLDTSRELVLTGADAKLEDLVWWALNSAKVTDEVNSAFKVTGKITIVRGAFWGKTDQYVGGGTYIVGTKLASENGLLFDGAALDMGIAFALGAPVNSVLEFVTMPVITI